MVNIFSLSFFRYIYLFITELYNNILMFKFFIINYTYNKNLYTYKYIF